MRRSQLFRACLGVAWLLSSSVGMAGELPPPRSPTLVYDAATGNVRLYPLEKNINQFNLHSDGQFLPNAIFEELEESTFGLPGLRTNSPDAIEWVVAVLIRIGFGDRPQDQKGADLGNILRPGLTPQAILELLTLNRWGALLEDSLNVTGSFEIDTIEPEFIVAEAGGPYYLRPGEDLVLAPTGTYLSRSNELRESMLDVSWDLDLDGNYGEASQIFVQDALAPLTQDIPMLIAPFVIPFDQLPSRLQTRGSHEISLRASALGTADFPDRLDTAQVIVVPEPAPVTLLVFYILLQSRQFGDASLRSLAS